MAVPAKKRKMNFSEREVEIIVEELELKKHLLVNHFNAGVPLAAKSAAWHGILRRVNAVATCRRELPEVKKKWSDLKTEVRRKVAQVRAAVEGGEAPGPTEEDGAGGPGTGGGSGAGGPAVAPVLLTPMQQRICNLLGEATIISLPSTAEIHPVALGPTATAAAATVTLTQSEWPLPPSPAFLNGKGQQELGQPREGWLPRVKGQMGVLDNQEAFQGLPRQKWCCFLSETSSARSLDFRGAGLPSTVLPPFASVTELFGPWRQRPCLYPHRTYPRAWRLVGSQEVFTEWVGRWTLTLDKDIVVFSVNIHLALLRNLPVPGVNLPLHSLINN